MLQCPGVCFSVYRLWPPVMTWHSVKSLCCPKSHACQVMWTNFAYSKFPWTLTDCLWWWGCERRWTKGCKVNTGQRLASAGGLTSVDKVTDRDRRPCVCVRWISGVTQTENVDLSQCVGSVICQKTQWDKRQPYAYKFLNVFFCYPTLDVLQCFTIMAFWEQDEHI